MKNSDLEKLIKKEYQQVTMENNKSKLMSEIAFVHQLDPEEKKKTNHYFASMIRFACVAAVFVLCILPFTKQKVDYLVSLDVNPSIDLRVNEDYRVSEVFARNQEAVEIIGDMDLIATDVDVAVNAIIGSMYRQGYIDEIKNSILVTVQGEDSEQRELIKEKVSKNVKSVLEGYSVESSILSQGIAQDDEVQALMEQYNISAGKVTLIQAIVEENPSIVFEDLVEVSIDDLNTLVHFKNIHFKSISIDGIESHEGYISIEQAKEKIFEHAQVSENDIYDFTYDVNAKQNHLQYEISFKDAYASYQYSVNTISGEISDVQMELIVEE